MAAIEERGGRFRIHFRWHGKQQKLPLGMVSAEEAASKAAKVDYLLMRLKQRLIELPPGDCRRPARRRDPLGGSSARAARR
jgi:hypothetical protein